MKITHISGYKFLRLENLSELRATLHMRCLTLQLKGTILLSQEGINLNICGTGDHISAFLTWLQKHLSYLAVDFKQTYTDIAPYQRLKVKIKKEIITLRQKNVDPTKKRAPSITPAELKKWLDEKKDTILLDTRNQYEIECGTFTQATNLGLHNFCQFPATTENLPREKPIVMFCTGGIRCEKAALYLLEHGFKNVYQLDGGILNYFANVGGAHYTGNCYVFDERVALTPQLQSIKEKD